MENIESGISETPDIHSSSDEYAKRFQGEFGKWALDVQGKITLKILKKYSNIKTILDVGGGHAQLCPFFEKEDYDVTILGSTEACQKRVEPYLKNKKFSFVAGNLLSLPFEDEAFDAVICYRQVCHIVNWQEFLGELSRVSKNIVVIDYPTYSSFNILNKFLFKLKKKIEKNTRQFKIFNDCEIKEEFERNDFYIKSKNPEYFLPLVVYRMINKEWLIKILEGFFSIWGFKKFLGSPVILEVKKK